MDKPDCIDAVPWICTQLCGSNNMESGRDSSMIIALVDTTLTSLLNPPFCCSAVAFKTANQTGTFIVLKAGDSRQRCAAVRHTTASPAPLRPREITACWMIVLLAEGITSLAGQC